MSKEERDDFGVPATDQLLDAVLVLSEIAEGDNPGDEYATSLVIKMDVEGQSLPAFITALGNLPGVIHVAVGKF